MNYKLLRALNTFGLAFLIGMNMLAVLLPLGNKTTGELSDLYPNLFVPSGFTFAIWSLIYILLIIFVGYQWIGKQKIEIVESIGIWFIINAVANGLWLVFWHYEYVIICFFIMLVILSSLIVLYRKIEVSYYNNRNIPWQTSVPISVYLGWISVATIANTTVVFVSRGYTNLGLGADTWAAAMMVVAVGLALWMLYKYKDIFFAAVVCWASFGIYSKRAADMTEMDYKIEHTSYIAIFILLIAILLTLVYSILNKKNATEN